MDACQTQSSIQHPRKRRAQSVRFFFAFALTLAVFAAPALASELPAAYTAVRLDGSTVPSDASGHVAERLAKPRTAAGPAISREKNRRIKVLNYSRVLELGHDEVTVRVQSPGKRRSLMMVELTF